MSKIRVLIVDDAVVFRRLVAEELSADPAIEVVGTAANGKIALARLTQVNPDLVILDIEMPELDGLATLREIRKTHPKLPVIMFSALTERGAAATLDALALGATDYFAKPVGVGGLDASLQVIRDELIPEIKALCPRERGPARVGTPTAAGTISGAPPGAAVEVVAIGTSTGGPNALAEVFAGFPADLPVPVVIVQHMPPMFTRLLAERLSAQSAVTVEEGRSGGVLRPGHGWLAPGDFHMAVARDGNQVRVLLHQDPPENSCRPAADVLFRSVAQTFGRNALAVVLTGMGQDGLRGCEIIRAAGGQVIVQDEPTSVVWGMPGFVARAGLADRVLPLGLIGPEIVRRVRDGRGVGR
ncbi:MAG TPA: chemotaxis response regulator protein-glutamate methylesterase [Gemmataceae bacterium]|nr:chemotaxis response regulator protein-glutamate methylesterase [Gemmataceae bacterium]